MRFVIRIRNRGDAGSRSADASGRLARFGRRLCGSYRSGVVRHVHRDYSSKEDALYLQELRALLNE